MNVSDLELPSNRKFGFFFTAVFLVVGAYFFTENSKAIAYVFLGLSTVFLLVAVLNADFLLPLNKLWMRFGLLLGMIVSPIVLGVIFFGLFTPISLFMKLVGRDELRLKLVNRSSHWKDRNADISPNDGFKYQF